MSPNTFYETNNTHTNICGNWPCWVYGTIMSHKQIFTNNITKRKIGRKKTYFSGKPKTKMTIWIFVLILIAGFDILFKPFWFSWSQTLKWSVFQSYGCESSWWRFYEKRVVHTKSDIAILLAQYIVCCIYCVTSYKSNVKTIASKIGITCLSSFLYE